MSTTSLVLSIVFGLGAGGAAIYLPFAIRSALALARDGVTTTGTVIEMEDVPQEGWIAHIRYRAGGAEHTIGVGSNGGYRVGEQVQVRYRRDDPARANVDSAGNVWMETIAVGVLAAIFAAVAILFVVLGRLRVL